MAHNSPPTFKEVAARLVALGVEVADIAAAIGRKPHTVKQMLFPTSALGYRNPPPPEVWRAPLARLARQRASALWSEADTLDRDRRPGDGVALGRFHTRHTGWVWQCPRSECGSYLKANAVELRERDPDAPTHFCECGVRVWFTEDGRRLLRTEIGPWIRHSWD